MIIHQMKVLGLFNFSKISKTLCKPYLYSTHSNESTQMGSFPGHRFIFRMFMWSKNHHHRIFTRFPNWRLLDGALNQSDYERKVSANHKAAGKPDAVYDRFFRQNLGLCIYLIVLNQKQFFYWKNLLYKKILRLTNKQSTTPVHPVTVTNLTTPVTSFKFNLTVTYRENFIGLWI